MLKHYKKLLLILIPLPVWFCLSLALGSTEEDCELCQLCQNKALAKQAIQALITQDVEQAYEVFDPNSTHSVYFFSGTLSLDTLLAFFYIEVKSLETDPYPKIEDIIAEGDKVVVRLDWWISGQAFPGPGYFGPKSIFIFRISDNLIKQSWQVHSFL